MTIGDKCPYSGRELLSGYLHSARQIIWSQEEKSISFRADEEGDLVVSRGVWEGSFADCRYCADCGIFLAASPADGRAWAAVLFAGITTMLSFGLLAFSATPALHAFGLTVLTGEAAVWAAAAALRPGRSALARSRRGEFPEDHSAGR